MPDLSSFRARCGLSVFSGVLYALAYPPLGWGWLVIPSLMILVAALRDQHGTRARAIGFIHGMTAFGVSLSWLFQIFGGISLMLWCVLAAFTALFAEMQARAGRRGITGWPLVIFTTLNWCGWEFIRAELFPLKFPWMTAGLAVGPNALLPWIGVYGVSLLVVLPVGLAAAGKWKYAVCLSAVPLLFLSIRSGDLQKIEATDPLAVKVGGLQFENVSLTEFLKGTKAFSNDIRYVVWPEYAVPYDLRENKRDWKLVQDLCRERNITLTLGTQLRPATSPGWRNIALTLDPTGVRGEHTKAHPVHFFDDGIAGTTALPVPTDHGKVGTPVCFDCDYEGVVRHMTTAGAEMFVVPMMDAEKWTARQHEQHAALFRIRACENGRWMFVCATSGVSQIIDPNGNVQSRLGASAQGPITGVMRRATQLTFYTRCGWLVPWIALSLAAVSWIVMLLPVRKPVPTEC